jgi:hypothetical protein
LFWHGKLRRPTFVTLLLSSLVATLLACAFSSTRHGTEPQYFDHSSYLAQQLKRLGASGVSGGPFRMVPVYFDPLAAPPWYRGTNPESATACFFQYGRQMLLPNTQMDFNLASTYGYEAAETGDYKTLFMGVLRRSWAHDSVHHGVSPVPGPRTDVPLARLCQMTSTSFVLSQVYRAAAGEEVPRLDPKYFKLLLDDRAMNARIYNVVDSLPRAYLPLSWSASDSRQDVIGRIIRSDTSGFDALRQTVLERPASALGTDQQNLLAGRSAANQFDSIKLLKDEPDHLLFEARVEKPRLMVLSDQYYPGWHASIDGIPATIYRANGVQRALMLPAGRHRVGFDYEPESLSTGFELALVSIGIFAALALLMAWRHLKTRTVAAGSSSVVGPWR